MSDRSHRFTIIELLAALFGLVLLLVILIPALQASRARARSTVCQNNLRQLASMFRKSQDNAGMNLRAENLRQHLDHYVKDKPEIWDCPNGRGPDSSYGFNERLHQLLVKDSGKIVALDYARPIARVTGLPFEDNWPTSVRPRHFAKCNVVFYDIHYEAMRPDDIYPGTCENQLRYWMPTVEARLLADQCGDAQD